MSDDHQCPRCGQILNLEPIIATLTKERDEWKMVAQNLYGKPLLDRIHSLEVENYDLKDRTNKADSKLESLGYRHCDIPACNCNSYHKWSETKQVEALIARIHILEEGVRVALKALERIVRYPVHSEPVGGAYEMQDIAFSELSTLKPLIKEGVE